MLYVHKMVTLVIAFEELKGSQRLLLLDTVPLTHP